MKTAALLSRRMEIGPRKWIGVLYMVCLLCIFPATSRATTKSLHISWGNPNPSTTNMARVVGDGDDWLFQVIIDPDVVVVDGPHWTAPHFSSSRKTTGDPAWGMWTVGANSLDWSGATTSGSFTVKATGKVRKNISGGTSGTNTGSVEEEDFSATWSGTENGDYKISIVATPNDVITAANPANTVDATLTTSAGVPVSGQSIHFDGNEISIKYPSDISTDTNGKASADLDDPVIQLGISRVTASVSILGQIYSSSVFLYTIGGDIRVLQNSLFGGASTNILVYGAYSPSTAPGESQHGVQLGAPMAEPVGVTYSWAVSSGADKAGITGSPGKMCDVKAASMSNTIGDITVDLTCSLHGVSASATHIALTAQQPVRRGSAPGSKGSTFSTSPFMPLANVAENTLTDPYGAYLTTSPRHVWLWGMKISYVCRSQFDLPLPVYWAESWPPNKAPVIVGNGQANDGGGNDDYWTNELSRAWSGNDDDVIFETDQSVYMAGTEVFSNHRKDTELPAIHLISNDAG